MQDIYAVLREKETAMKRVRREIQALRLVCKMLESKKDSGMDSIRITLDSSVEGEEKIDGVSPIDEKKVALEQIRAKFVEARQKEIKKENAIGFLLRFRQAALNASHTFLKRVGDGRLWERGAPRSGRDVFDRFGRAA